MTPFVLFVNLNGFYVGSLGLNGEQPAIIHRNKRVLDLNAAASSRGLERSAGLPEAKAMFGREGMYVEWEEDAYLADRNDWLDVVTQFADVIEPVDQHQCFVDLSAHPDPGDVAEQIQAALKAQTGLEACIGMASCRWIAQVESFGFGLPLCSLPVSYFPIAEELTTRLVGLGCTKIGEVRQFPLEQLKRQFGKDAFLIHQAANGQGDSAVKALYPLNSISDRFLFDGIADTREVLENGVVFLAKKVGRRLTDEGVFSKSLHVWLEDEDGSVTFHERTFGKPIGSPASLNFALNLLLSELCHPISCIRIRLPDLAPKKRTQRTLIGMTAEGAKDESAQNALGQLRTKFGNDSILLANQVAVERYVRVRQAWRAVNGWSWK